MPSPSPEHPRLEALIQRARDRARAQGAPRLGLVYPGDALALQAARRIADEGIARVVLIGPSDTIRQAARAAGMVLDGMELLDVPGAAPASAQRAAGLARDGALQMLMKGSLHTDELMSAVVSRSAGLRGSSRISHVFLFDLPRYGKLLALADCVVNISPSLPAKRDILGNAVTLLQKVGIAHPKVGILAAVETVNPSIPATLDAEALVKDARGGQWPGAIVEGPFGFDNAISAQAARIKGIQSEVAGDADLLIVPDLNAGNMLYKSFNYIGGGDCAGLIVGARIPIVLTSRADSSLARLASVALGVLAADTPEAPADT